MPTGTRGAGVAFPGFYPRRRSCCFCSGISAGGLLAGGAWFAGVKAFGRVGQTAVREPYDFAVSRADVAGGAGQP